MIKVASYNIRKGIGADRRRKASYRFRDGVAPDPQLRLVAQRKTDGSAITYVVQVTKTGTKYHLATCRYLRKSSIPITLKDATAKGLAHARSMLGFSQHREEIKNAT